MATAPILFVSGRVEVEGGLGVVIAENLDEANVIIYTVVPALNYFHHDLLFVPDLPDPEKREGLTKGVLGVHRKETLVRREFVGRD